MKRIILLIGGLCLIVNVLCGCVLSAYSTFNCAVTSGVILLNMLMLYLVSAIELKDAFRISLNCLFPVMAIIEFLMGLFSPEQFKDNGFIIFIAFSLLVEGIILIVTNTISKK